MVSDVEAGARFLNLAQVGDELGTSTSQVYALVRSGVLRAIKVGGRGQWRVGREDLEAFIAGAYVDTRAFVAERPVGVPGSSTADDVGDVEIVTDPETVDTDDEGDGS